MSLPDVDCSQTGVYEWKIRHFDSSVFSKDNDLVYLSAYFKVDCYLHSCFLTLRGVKRRTNDTALEVELWFSVGQSFKPAYKRFHFFINGCYETCYIHDSKSCDNYLVLRTSYSTLFTSKDEADVTKGVVTVKWIPRNEGNADRYEELNRNLGAMLQNGEFSDVVIETDCSRFPVHKVVLSSWSPVFRAMMKAEMQESKFGSIRISDFSEQAVKNMLNHMYMGLLPKKYNYIEAAELLKIADKYDLKVLRYRYVEYLLCELDASNALELLSLAHECGEDRLKTEVLQFISENREEFSDGDAFDKLKDKPEILISILNTLVKPCDVLSV